MNIHVGTYINALLETFWTALGLYRASCKWFGPSLKTSGPCLKCDPELLHGPKGGLAEAVRAKTGRQRGPLGRELVQLSQLL